MHLRMSLPAVITCKARKPMKIELQSVWYITF